MYNHFSSPESSHFSKPHGQVCHRGAPLVTTFCISSFSVAVIKHCDQGNLSKESCIWASCSGGMSPLPSGQRSVTAYRHSDQTWKLRAKSSHLKSQTRGRECELRIAHGLWNLKEETLLPGRPYLLNCPKRWPNKAKYANAQAYRDISFKPLQLFS